MSDVILTERERRNVGQAAQISLVHWAASGIDPHGYLWCRDAGWDRALDLCGCRFPTYQVLDGVRGLTISPRTTWN